MERTFIAGWEFGEGQVQLRLELATGLPRIEADAAQIQQVVMNLVINAAEAIPEGQVGTVLIATAMQDIHNVYCQSTSVDAHLTPRRVRQPGSSG